MQISTFSRRWDNTTSDLLYFISFWLGDYPPFQGTMLRPGLYFNKLKNNYLSIFLWKCLLGHVLFFWIANSEVCALDYGVESVFSYLPLVLSWSSWAVGPGQTACCQDLLLCALWGRQRQFLNPKVATLTLANNIGNLHTLLLMYTRVYLLKTDSLKTKTKTFFSFFFI